MKNKQIHKILCHIVLTLVLLIVAVYSGNVKVPAFAVATEYTNVLDDLKKEVNDIIKKEYDEFLKNGMNEEARGLLKV